MTRRLYVPLSLLIVLGLTLPQLLFSVPIATGTSEQPVAAPAAPVDYASRRDGKRKNRTAAPERERTAKAESVLPLDQLDLDLGRAGNWLDFCDGPFSVPLLQNELCTHGPDPAPRGFDAALPVGPLSDRDASAATDAVACEGDGQTGFRVQVLYVHGADVASRYDRFRLSIQGWAAGMDQIFQASAAETGGVRGLRFVHDANCQPIVDAVEVSPAGDGSFDATITALRNNGYNRTNRIYRAFVDTTAAGICGIGTAWSDDRANGSVNRNNGGPAYSRVDAGCWSAHVAAHEVMHNLGGVQHSAPNASGGFHCIDEWDVMCYQDGSGPSMRVDCPDRARDATRFDCNHDDYFHPNPPAGSYLANHWNTANSRFLIGSTAPAVTERSPKDNDFRKNKKDNKGKKGKKDKGGKKRR